MIVDGVPYFAIERVVYQDYCRTLWTDRAGGSAVQYWDTSLANTPCEGLVPSDSGGVGPSHGFVALRHADGFNALFADGHTQHLRVSTPEMWAADPLQIDDYQRSKIKACEEPLK